MLAASASVPALIRPATGTATVSAVPTPGYGVDPPLMAPYQSGQLWPLLLSEAEKRTATVLCDTLIPADHASPSASEVGVVAFIDEWVSAPYPEQLRDRPLVRQGLEWIDAEARRDYKRALPTSKRQTELASAIGSAITIAPRLRIARRLGSSRASSS
jgi:hypothetical protein